MDIYCNCIYDYILALLLVFMNIYWRYDAGSWFLSLMGMLQIVLAITVSMFVYRYVCQVDLVCDLEQLFSASQNICAVCNCCELGALFRFNELVGRFSHNGRRCGRSFCVGGRLETNEKCGFTHEKGS